MKKLIAMLLALVMVLGLCACTVSQADPTEPPVEGSEGGEPAATTTEITLWTYPIGGWGDQAVVADLIANFEAANEGIKVTVEYLDYTNGDDKVNTAIEGGAAPDLIMEGPERLVANWGAKGLMVDLSDLIDDTDVAELNPAAYAACVTADGKTYEYPLVMTAHCMAINKTVFEAAGAMQYLNAEHTEYTWNSAENIAALQALVDCEGIEFDAGIVGGDEIKYFYNGQLNMAFCWNIAQQLDPNTAGTGAGLNALGEEIMFMAFPSDTTPQLCGGIWGFGIFNNGNDAKIAAAKTFIKYMCDSAATADAVKAANYFAVRNTAEGADLSNIWADNAIMAEYNVLMPMLGDYYQVTTGWAEARTAWWNMLQAVGAGEDIAASVELWANTANGK